jgi:hypothetical protein
MAQFIPIALIAAVIFGICYLVDKGFSKLFRSKAQHRSGMAVRANKRYGIFGVVLTVLGIMAICVGVTDGPVLIWGGIFVLLMGVALAVYYLSFGIFYDGESLLLQRFGKKDLSYAYREIVGQKLYLIQGGSIVIELHMADGSALSVQSSFEGTYPFLDAAFSAWCRQTGREESECDFHDPSQSLWFPTVEDV